MKKLKLILKKKKFIDNFYRKNLDKFKQIKFSKKIKNADPIYWFTAIQVKNKYGLKKFLSTKNIETRDFFYPMHLQKCFKKDKNVIKKESNFKDAIDLYKNGICLPSSVNLKKRQLIYIIDQIKNFYESRN